MKCSKTRRKLLSRQAFFLDWWVRKLISRQASCLIGVLTASLMCWSVGLAAVSPVSQIVRRFLLVSCARSVAIARWFVGLLRSISFFQGGGLTASLIGNPYVSLIV